MNRIAFPLAPGTQGPEVAGLQDALQLCLDRGTTLANEEEARRELSGALQRERGEQTYGSATEKLVAIFQGERRLPSSGEVDEPTASALNLLLREWGLLDSGTALTFQVVTGAVEYEDDRPPAGTQVRAVHESERGAIRLGEDTTDADGRYTIRYEPLPGVDAIHLRVRVTDEDGRVLLASEVIRGAQPLEHLDLSIPVAEPSVADHRIEGRVVLERGLPANMLPLRLYRRDFGGGTTRLGEDAVTDRDGHYVFNYQPDAGGMSLEIRAVTADGEELPLTEPLDDISTEPYTELNLIAPSSLQPLAAEYRRLSADLTTQVGDMARLAEAKENTERQDLTVLNRATGWDARLIALAGTSAQLSADADVALPQEVVYGLLRAGLPSDKLRLAQVEPDAVVAALKAVREAGIVALEDPEIEAAEEHFATFRNKLRLSLPAPGSLSTYGQMLDASSVFQNDAAGREMRDTFADLYLNHRGDAAKLWEKARDAGLDDTQIGTLQLEGKFAFLTGNSAAITALLLRKDITEPARLVDHGFDEAETWAKEVRAQVGVSDDSARWTEAQKNDLAALIPKVYGADKVEDRLGAYAEDMARKVRLSYPTQVVARMVEEPDKLSLPDEQARAATAKLLKNAAQQGFRLGETPVKAFFETHAGVTDGIETEELPAAISQIKQLQRVYQITPSNEAMPVLMKTGMTSAYEVTGLSLESFSDRYVAEYLEVHQKGPPSKSEPELIYRKAQQVSSVSYNLFTIARTLDSEPGMNAVSVPADRREAVRDEVRRELIKRYPTMESLFGSMDYCECDHCRSVLSPAAYLVDLLQFIDTESEPQVWADFKARWKTSHGGQDYPHQDADGKPMTPYQVLIERRPDLPQIPLTCENTHTALPYIDVVNEVLEYYVAYGKLEEGAAHSTGEATTEEQLAEPQNVIAEAYDELDKARYPIGLPFDLWIETARRFCDYFETPLAQVLETFRRSDKLFDPEQSPDRYSVLVESLGLSPAEAKLLTAASYLTDDRWYALYGLPVIRSVIHDPTNTGNAALAIANADAEQLRAGFACTFFSERAGRLSKETKTIASIGASDSSGPGRATISFTGTWEAAGEPRPEEDDSLTCNAPAMLSSAKTLSRYLDVSYKEIVEIVQTGFVNPNLEQLVLLYKLGVTLQDARQYALRKPFYEENKDLVDVDRADLSADDRQRFDALSQQVDGTKRTGWEIVNEAAAFERRVGELAKRIAKEPGQESDQLVVKEKLLRDIEALPFGTTLVLADIDAGCNFDQTKLQYADGTKADAIVFLRINLFVRLWRKLGWSIEETDRALSAFVPRAIRAGDDATELADWLKTALIYLAHLETLDQKLQPGKQSRIKLLTLWSDIATTGKQPLYAQLLLTRSVLKSAPVFDHPLGDYLSPMWLQTQAQSRTYRVARDHVGPGDKIDATLFTAEPRITLSYDDLQEVQTLSFVGPMSDADKEALRAMAPSDLLKGLLDEVQGKAGAFSLVKGHMLALQGALGLSSDDIERILEDAGLELDAAELTLANVSLFYRHGLLAKALKLTVRELIALKQLSGRNPFKPLHDRPPQAIEEDHPFCETLRFIEIVEQVKESGLNVEDLDYLLRHRYDETGKYRPNREGTLVLLKALADGIRTIRAEHAVPDDPAVLSEEDLRQKLGLILPAEAVDRFLAMFNGTAEFTATVTSVAKEDQLDAASFIGQRVFGEMTYDEGQTEQTLVFRGVLLDEQKAALKTKFKPPKLSAGQHETLERLLDRVQELTEQKAKEDLFVKHLEQQELSQFAVRGFLSIEDYNMLFARAASDDGTVEGREQREAQLREKLERLAKAFLPYLQERLIRQFIVEKLTAHTGADAALVDSLVTDRRLLTAADSGPLLTSFATTDERGLSAIYFDSDAPEAEPVREEVVRVASTSLIEPTDAVRRARFDGYLEVAAPGPYRFDFELDEQNAEAELHFDHLPGPILVTRGEARNDGVMDVLVDLKPGIPYRFRLTLNNLSGGGARLQVRGETLPKGAISELILYPLSAMEKADHAVLLLTKVLQLIQSLGLNERETRHFLAADGFDDLRLSELPTVMTRDAPAQESTSKRFNQLVRLAAYARLKRELGGGTDGLIGVFETSKGSRPGDGPAPNDEPTDTQDGRLNRCYELIAKLTRRERPTVMACAKLLADKPEFDDERSVVRLWQALKVVERFGVPVASLREWTDVVSPTATPEERFDIARGIRDAVKARFDADTWRRIGQPIFDKLRQRQRDALVAYVMHNHRFDRVEQLYEHFLIDPGMEPVVQTSRIRLAIASLQLFIQRCLLNLEPNVNPSLINAKHWEWMKRYRVWEANRKIFLFPENWLEPEFRDDKTHLFSELEGALLQGDVSNDLAEDAFLNYLRKLDELAQLEIVAMHIEDSYGPAPNTLHVFGRTASTPHQYFYRRYARQMWTPWEPVTAEIEGNHLAPVVWRDRLYLFWATFMEVAERSVSSDTVDRKLGPNLMDPGLMELVNKYALPATGKQKETEKAEGKGIAEMSPSEVRSNAIVAMPERKFKVQLSWSEYLQGKWSPGEAGDFDTAFQTTVDSGFKPSGVFVHVTKEYDQDEERGVIIHLGGNINKGFRLVGRNGPLEWTSYSRAPRSSYPGASNTLFGRYVGSGAFTVNFKQRITTEAGKEAASESATLAILKRQTSHTLVPCNTTFAAPGVSEEAYRDPQEPAAVKAALERSVVDLAPLMNPVFYQGAGHVLFVEPEVTERTIEEWEEWVTRTPVPDVVQSEPDVWKGPWVIPEIPRKWPIRDPIDLQAFGPSIDYRSRIQPKLDSDWLVNRGTGLLFDGDVIGPNGRLPAVLVATPTADDLSARGAQLRVSTGSALSSDSAVVVSDTGAIERSGLRQAAGGLNLVGAAGFNSALAQNLETFHRTSLVEAIAGLDRIGR